MNWLINLIGLAGFSALSSGVYLNWGEGWAAMVGGALALLFALKAASVKRG